MKTVLFLALCSVWVGVLMARPKAPVGNHTLLDLAKESRSLKMFVELAIQSEFGDKMKEQGPWTLFAANTLAFMELDHSYLETLRNNKTLLEKFLQYHAVKGLYMKKDLDANDMELKSMSGENIRVNLYRSTSKITVEGCRIISFDNMAANGVLHVIEEVLLPPENNLFLTLKNDPKFSIFTDLLSQVGLDKELENGPYTVFAPADGAFNSLGKRYLDRLRKNHQVLEELLKTHIVHGILWKAGMHDTYLETLTGHSKISITDSFLGLLSVEDALIIDRDIPATNGVIHELHKVLDIRSIGSSIIG